MENSTLAPEQISTHISIKDIKKSFSGKIILKNITLDAKELDIIGLIGKSGCGKSTFLKILVGYYKADSGKIELNGKDISKDSKALRKIVGYTTQDNSFYEKLSVIENMKYYSNIYNVPLKVQETRIKELLTDVGLYEHKDKLAENISGGMKRRLDFAISLVHDPKILVLDEPTVGLDPLLIDQFWNIVQKVVKKDKKIAIISSHILSELEKNSTKAVFMNNGEIIKELEKKDIKDLDKKFREYIK
jgi:ABC-2 type transport system ATP-binding protein